MSARRILVLTAVFVLVLVSVAAGFLFPGEASSRTLVVDLRARPAAAELDKRIKENQTGTPPIVVATPSQITNSCIVAVPASPLSNPAYCAAINTDPITLITDDSQTGPPELLQKIYGPDSEIKGEKAFWESTKTTSTGFNPVAALVTFAVTAVVITAGLITIRLRRSSPNRVPAMREAISVNQQRARPHNPLPQPQMAGARSGGTPPPRQPARSAQPVRGIASELTPLVTRANRRAIARTHINSHGGYVAVGDVVVWAVLAPTEEGVVVPDDELDVLGVDERAETLVVAPAGSPSPGRRPRP